jgi:hypothetical protein
LITLTYKVKWGLKAFCIKNVIRIKSNVKKSWVRYHLARLVYAAKTTIKSISILKVRQLNVITLCLWSASEILINYEILIFHYQNSQNILVLDLLINAFYVESMKCDLNFFVFLSQKIIMTFDITWIKARIIRRWKVTTPFLWTSKI